MILLVSALLLIGNSIANYETDNYQLIWKLVKALFPSLNDDIHKLEDTLREIETPVAFLPNVISLVHEELNKLHTSLYNKPSGKHRDKCLTVFENYASRINTTLLNGNECFEKVFEKYRFQNSSLQVAKSVCSKLLNSYETTVNKVKNKLQDSKAYILGLKGTFNESEEVYLDATNYTFKSYENVRTKYNDIYPDVRKVVDDIKKMAPELKNCEKKMSLEDEVETEEINCINYARGKPMSK